MSDAEIRADQSLVGRAAYEASVKARPNYHDGTPRKTWEQLGDFERMTWNWNCGIPVTRLLGQALDTDAPGSENDLKNYYDRMQGSGDESL